MKDLVHPRKKIALIGASVRAGTLVKALVKDYSDRYECCAVLDSDPYKLKSFTTYNRLDVPCFKETEFDRLCRECRPDLAVITTTDTTHAAYVVQCLDHHISCLVEKPLCIDAEQCRRILEAQRRNPSVYARTMHNSRYHQTFHALKSLVDAGTIGKIRSIYYDEKLDLFHGSSYFRRWNRTKALSGGLQITKSCHHFDKINWLLKSKPAQVSAQGRQIAYGPNASRFRGEKCSACGHTDECPFYLDARQNPVYRELYFSASDASVPPYSPDLCVFDPEADAEDFVHVNCVYANGVPMSYTLNAHSNYEGETVHIEGETGRLEMCRHTFRAIVHRGFDKVLRQENSLRLIRFGQEAVETFPVDDEEGETHGGADRRIYADLFGGESSDFVASLEDGVQAVLVGAAANLSIAEGRVIHVQDLLNKRLY